ncbi:MAG: TerB family tellurite resistance protein [SAR324 cluster bacterium]|nr:TerB family tellurite resistance protein [SAR324 cluster bacterium]
MFVPLHKFNEDQRLWFGKLMVEAIKTDGDVEREEVTLLLMTIEFLTARQKKLIAEIFKIKGSMPGLHNIPKGITDRHLIDIYCQLVVVVAADSDFSSTEHAFLAQVREWFLFTPEMIVKLTDWSENMTKVIADRHEMILIQDAITAANQEKKKK